MRVVVLGAGLLGVTAAYYLQQLGHEVIVVDRHATPAAKARGRVLQDAPGTAASLSAAIPARSGVLGRMSRVREAVRRQMGKLIDRVIGAPAVDPRDYLVRLAAYSRQSARALGDEAGLSQGGRTSAGQMNVYTDTADFNDRVARDLRWQALGCEEQLISPDEAIRMEPALHPIHDELAGATYSSEDPARDPSQFAASIVFLCRAAGVRFLTRHTVVSLKERDGRIHHVEALDANGQSVRLRGQAYVLALGASSVPHAEELGIHMPLHFVREYIVTMPILDTARAPRIALRDRQGKLRITRVGSPTGDFLRISHTVRMNNDEQSEPDSDHFEAMLRRVRQILPGAADPSRASLDTAVHAVSRDRLPLIGKTRVPNLFLNAAPGTPTWVNAIGAGKSIARIVTGLRPEVDIAFKPL